MSRYNKDLYNWYKEHHICPTCGQRKAAPNRVRCDRCLEKNADRSHKRRTPEEQRAYREEHKAKGLCIECNRPLARDSKCYCIDHLTRARRKREERRDGITREERPAYGLCYRCGKPITSGKLCDRCTEQSIKNLPKQSADSGWYQYHKRMNRAVFGG